MLFTSCPHSQMRPKATDLPLVIRKRVEQRIHDVLKNTGACILHQ